MKRLLIIFFASAILCTGYQSLFSQEEEKDSSREISTKLITMTHPPYNPEGRRDPFRDLLAGRDVEEKGLITGIAQMSVDNVNLIGIVKVKGKYTAIIESRQAFPLYIKVGDEFSDGSVISIQETKVIFRKVSQQGVPLFKPRNIVKELNPEER